MQPYPEAIEQMMRKFYQTLSEKDQRRYAALEAMKLGHGGICYIAQVLGCARQTVGAGMRELEALPEDPDYDPRIRQQGGGRKGYEETWPGIHEAFLQVVETRTAGDPMREEVRWTNLTPAEIAQRLADEQGMPVSVTVVHQLLAAHHYRRRKAQKKATRKEVAHRNEQFDYIAQLKARYQAEGQPVVSIDTKKKEVLGNFYREGHLYTTGELRVYDHDFHSWASGFVIPHALYDLQRNTGFLNLGASHDTSAFACDSIRHWWQQEGRLCYPQATKLLLLCDGGGSNSCRHYLFKEELQKLANDLGLAIRVAHYPPYCSKYNPIEHRLFPHVTRACQGVIFHSVEQVRTLMARAHTQTGLSVTVNIIDKVYDVGCQASEEFKQAMPIVFDDKLPAWNYKAVPQSA